MIKLLIVEIKFGV